MKTDRGTPVGTPVHIVVVGDHAFFRTYDAAGKVGRIQRTPAVTITPSTVRGQLTGSPLQAHARLLDGEEARSAARALAHKYPLLHGRLIPLFHTLKRYQTVHFKLTPEVPK